MTYISGQIGINFVNGTTQVPAGGLSIVLSDALSDLTAHGVITTGTVTPSATFGQCLMISGGNYILTDADSSSTMPCMALAIDTGSGSDKALLLQGYMRDDTWSWTSGGLLYASTTAGGMTQTAPSGSGDQVQPIGYAVTSTIIYFNPSFHTVEIV